MTQHSSLKGVSVGRRHRNVLKRHERIRSLRDSDLWGGRQSVYKLPKQKLIKLKVKKAKAEKEAPPVAAGAAAAQIPPTPPPQKPAPEKAKGKEKQ